MALSEAEELELLDLLEAERRHAQATNIMAFARAIQIPGAPPPSEMSDAAAITKNPAWKAPEGFEDVEFYSNMQQPAAHHDLILAAVQDLIDNRLKAADGVDVDGLVITIPPGSGKSSYASLVVPAFVMGYKPSTNIIGASYAQELSDRFSRRVRSIVSSKEYGTVFPDAKLADGDSAVRGWSLSNGSEYRSTGIGAGIAGFRCVVGDTLIQTMNGPVRIDNIFATPECYEVLSYDEADARPVYRRIVAAARSTSYDIWRLRTASGGMVEATGDHRVFTAQRGWVEAQHLALGDVLLQSVPDARATPFVRGQADHATILQPSMCDGGQYRSASCSATPVHRLRSYVRAAHEISERLFMRARVFAGVCGYRAIGDIQWHGQPALEGRPILRPRLRSPQQPHEVLPGKLAGRVPRYPSARRSLLRSLWSVIWPLGGPSHGQRPEEPRGEQSRAALPPSPQAVARGGAGWTAVGDPVVSIERVYGGAFVYDIQVADTECFFANGLLVHNCNILICDDLIANREDAESPVIRNKISAALGDDLFPRAKGNWFKVIMINTRFHEDDHIGRLLGVEKYKGQSGHWTGADGRRWYIINLPLHAEHDDDPLGRERGQLLWPEWYKKRDADRLRADRTPQGIRRYASLYQQRPAPNEGSILLRSYWRPWGKLVEKGNEWINDKEPPDFETLIISYDTAIEAGEENDPSAGTFWGIFEATVTLPDKRQVKQNHAMLFGAWQERIAAADLLAKVEGHIKKYKPDLVLVEKRASGAQLIQELKRRRWPVRAWLPKGRPGSLGKVPRANSIVNVLEQGCIWYYPVHHSVATTPPQAVLDQCAAFPNAAHDDLVDTVTQFLSWARTFQLIQLPTDPLSLVEEDEMRDRQNAEGMEGRRLYARPASHGVGKTKPLIEGKRRLYGR